MSRKMLEQMGLDDSDIEKDDDAPEENLEDAPEQEEQDAPEETDDQVESDDEDEPPKPKYYQDSEDEVEKAKQHGWKTFEEHVAEGKDPAAWKTAKHFNEYGDFVEKLKHTRNDFDTRLSNVQILFKGQMDQLKNQNEQLQRQRREAIEMGDADTVEKLDGAIGQNALQTFQLNQSMQAPTNPVPNDPYGRTYAQLEMETKFERENPWISGQDEKAVKIQGYFNELLNQGLPPEKQYELLQQKVKELNSPQSNPNRQKPAVTDNRQKNTQSSNSLAWSDLTPAELADWKAFGELMFKDDKKAFLKACKDARKGA